MKQRYRIDGRFVVADEEGFNQALAKAQASKTPVFCGCSSGVDLRLYISKRFGKLVLSRWPGSGGNHATGCDHFDAPDFLSGMGQVRGAAVVDDEMTGETSLKVNFPMSRGPARAAPSALTNDKPSVKSTGYKLSMRGLLHVLWDRAELTHWHPKMADKRNWYVVRRALLEAVEQCRMKTLPLAGLIFVPESFREDDKAEIVKRRTMALERVRRSREEMMIVIAEVKERKAFEDRLRIVFKHVGDMRFVLDPDMAKRFNKRFEGDLNLWASDDLRESHLILAGSFCRRPEGTYDLIEVALMPVTRQWLPYESSEELELIEKAVREKRRFVKGLRVNLERTVPIASLVLKDMGERAVAVHIHDEKIEAGEALAALLDEQSVDHYLWWEGEDLPKRGERGPQGAGSAASAKPPVAGGPQRDQEKAAEENVPGDAQASRGFAAYADG
ncbi:MAG: DUF1173 family protein [Sphingomonadales bacterium]|nr:DUF1173 family protein [Sphingomonadales bacterium]MBK9269924.1 DUF1173 family protein [Sphingomonadales bacterium]